MYKQGDILVDKDGKKRKILGICGEIILVSHSDRFDNFFRGYTENDLLHLNFKLKPNTKDKEEELIDKYVDRYGDNYGYKLEIKNILSDFIKEYKEIK